MRRRILAACLVCSLGLSAALAPAGEPSQEHAAPGGIAALNLNAGRPWSTDPPLRQGMKAIRAAVARDLPAIHHGTETPEQYVALAATITGQVAYIVKNCKLEPAADAQLHRVIGELVAAAEIMRGTQANVARADGAARAVSALDAYGRYFAHPGWQALEH